jgi:hypothetical protein
MGGAGAARRGWAALTYAPGQTDDPAASQGNAPRRGTIGAKLHALVAVRWREPARNRHVGAPGEVPAPTGSASLKDLGKG